MVVKQRLMGIILIIIGILPLFLKIEAIKTSLSQYTFLTYLMPGEIIYQIVLILLGILLLRTRAYYR